jgi:putative nucleotidyltransferase with HDIG domain
MAAAATAYREPEEIARTLEALPPLPAIALRVMEIVQDPNSSAKDIALIVSADPGLTAAMLRVANSAAYRRSRDVTSVQEALVVLGFVQARNIAMSSAITGAYAPSAANALFRIEAFWRHSIAVALKASKLAANTRGVEPAAAFTAGILHNIGRLAMFYANPAGLDQTVAEVMRRGVAIEFAERVLMGYDHSALGAVLAEKWRLPSEIVEAIRNHHTDANGDPTLGSVVAEADKYCIAHGILPGYIIPGTPRPVGDVEFDRLRTEVEGLMEQVNGYPIGVRFD